MMNDGLLALIQLQDTDQDMKLLKAEVEALPKKLAALEEQLAMQRSGVEAAAKAMKEEEAKRRRMESDLKDLHQKILKFREQSSSVKTNEQFRALQHEVSFAEDEIRKNEDRELDSMERSEQLESSLRAAEQEFKDHTRVVDLEKDAARKSSEEQQARMASLDEERSRLRGLVPEKWLTVYDRVTRARGSGLARVIGQTCMSCRMALRPQLLNQVHSGELIPCESCGRLLYFDAETAPVGEAASGKLKNKITAEP